MAQTFPFKCDYCGCDFVKSAGRHNRDIKAKARQSFCSRLCFQKKVQQLRGTKWRKSAWETRIRKRQCDRCVDGVAISGEQKCQDCLDFSKLSSDDKRAAMLDVKTCADCNNDAAEGKQRCNKHLRMKGSRTIESNRKLKLETFAAYGGSVCACCGEGRLEMLTLDHVNKDGHIHRRRVFGENKSKGGSPLYRRLKDEGFPKDFDLRVLCFNCNTSNGFYGCCPHETERAMTDRDIRLSFNC